MANGVFGLSLSNNSFLFNNKKNKIKNFSIFLTKNKGILNINYKKDLLSKKFIQIK